MVDTRTTILEGKVHLYRRGDVWHCAASVGKKQHRKSTEVEELAEARDVHECVFAVLALESEPIDPRL